MKFTSDSVKMAHRIAKAVHVPGESYAVTFGQSMRVAIAMLERLTKRALGSPVIVRAGEIGAYCDDACEFYRIAGHTVADGVTYSEGFQTFKSARAAQYVRSLIDNCDSFELTLQTDPGFPPVKIVR